MTTPPIELAATVERVERKEPPEPDGWMILQRHNEVYGWDGPTGRVYFPRDQEATVRMIVAEMAKSTPVRLVRIAPAPSPAETGAVPSEDVREAFNLLKLYAVHDALCPIVGRYVLSSCTCGRDMAIDTLAKALGVPR